MRNERGLTLIEAIVVLAILAVGSTVVAPRLINSKEQSQVMSIESDRSILKTKCSVYYLNTSTHATKALKLTEVMDASTSKFVDWLSNRLGLPLGTASTLDEIDKRFAWISSQKLLDTKLLDAVPKDDRYILDIDTYTVYHVMDSEEVWERLFVSSGSHLNSLTNMSLRRFPIETSTTYMEQVNATTIAGNIIYAGGKGTMALAKIEVGVSTQYVTDISSKLPTAVEVYGVSIVGSGLRVEYLDNTGKVVIANVAF